MENERMDLFFNAISIDRHGNEYVHHLHGDTPVAVLRNSIESPGSSCSKIAVLGAGVETVLKKSAGLDTPPPHRHDTYSLVLVLHGSITCSIGGHIMRGTAGHSILLDRNTEFYDVYSEDTDIAFVHLKEAFLLDLLRIGNNSSPGLTLLLRLLENERVRNRCVYSLSPNSGDIPRVLEAATEQLFNCLSHCGKDSNIFDLMSSVTRLFDLFLDRRFFTLSETRQELSQSEVLFTRITNILATRKGRVSRAYLENVMNYNGEYLNRIVKHYTGLTITQYSRDITVHDVAVRLSESDVPVGRLLDEAGVTNGNLFYRHFKNKYGCTPLQYRKMYRKEHPTEKRPEH